ncbi:Nba1p PWA37_004264 [Arxiozyma heterogenica]|uniref:Uncharacterized protein n=1 Tax=Arxiozyma heterogenica TaxID=278026 RepID=A0AAN8A6U1_9SACH|nr:hypothetical protein RI543_003278 [Kazachstania heterogenica]
MQIEKTDLANLNKNTDNYKINRSIKGQPNIPNLPSKETLAYARKISEQLNYDNQNVNGVNFQDRLDDDHILTLSSNIKDIRRQYSNYSSIGSGNLASESGTSHARYETESELEHFHMRDAFDQLDYEYNSSMDNTKIIVPLPRNKNRPKSQICVLNETNSFNTNIQGPPSIKIQYVGDLGVKTEGRDRNIVIEDNNYKYKHTAESKDEVQEHKEEEGGDINEYLQRPVPEEPLKGDDSNKDVENSSIIENIQQHDDNDCCDTKDSTSAKKTFSIQQQRNINTLSQLISIANTSTVGMEFDRLSIPNEEKMLLEQFIDTLSRLAVDIFLDPSRRTEILKRLDSATRVLEGF